MPDLALAATDELSMNNCVVQYYRCPESYVQLNLRGPVSDRSGYFEFGTGTMCYGKCARHVPSRSPIGVVPDVLSDTAIEGGAVYLPFDLSEVVKNLRCELYTPDGSSFAQASMLARAYYLVRPVLSVSNRKHLQRWRLRDWQRLPFPHWPVDSSVDQMLEQILLFSLRAQGTHQIPFVWFWP